MDKYDGLAHWLNFDLDTEYLEKIRTYRIIDGWWTFDQEALNDGMSFEELSALLNSDFEWNKASKGDLAYGRV
jgi:hypothetical protein